MTYPIGKLSFEAKKANALFFTGTGQLWVQPLWGGPILVDAEGSRVLPGAPPRAQALWGDAERVLLRSDDVLDEGGTLLDVISLVTRGLDGAPMGEPLVLARLAQGAGSVRHVATDGTTASVLAEIGDRTTLTLWSIARRERLAEHTLSRSASLVLASAVTHEAAWAVVGEELVAFPLDAGAPRARALAPAGRPFSPMGGASRLPTSLAADVLVQGLGAGELSLHGPTGLVFAHESPGGYGARSVSASVASISARGALVVAAVGSEASSGTPLLEVFDRSGALVRRIAWKCGKSETVYDVAIDDAGWIALATTHRAELFAPEDHVAPKKTKKT